VIISAQRAVIISAFSLINSLHRLHSVRFMSVADLSLDPGDEPATGGPMEDRFFIVGVIAFGFLTVALVTIELFSR